MVQEFTMLEGKYLRFQLNNYHLRIGVNNPAHLLILLAIFAIGLYFDVLFHTSRNLWMIGLLHGRGDFFIDGLPLLLGATIRAGYLQAVIPGTEMFRRCHKSHWASRICRRAIGWRQCPLIRLSRD